VPPYSKEGEARARFALGLGPEATFADARAAAKRLWATVHPDGATSPEGRAWRQAEFTKVGAAFDYLKAHLWEKAA